ncbi:hypothetical protein PR048_009843 [Dryococelus australis]|uniref:DDE-1 domain-containing protein n=1 Tax=Dryococelus australis TaxID=614101 RepID=A0ABQ9I230_9NEOP|nr:hypothetical protein PR048_009843 [Dryococelus australis]
MGWKKEATKTFPVPKTTSIRLSNEKYGGPQKATNTKWGHRTLLTPELEEQHVQYCLGMEANLFGMTRGDLRRMAFQLAERNNLRNPFSKADDIAGRKWLKIHTRNIEAVDMARDNNVTIVSLPPHSRHKMQPLDKTFLSPLKTYYREAVRQFLLTNNHVIANREIVALFGHSYIKCQTIAIVAMALKAWSNQNRKEEEEWAVEDEEEAVEEDME